jgi:RanBP-type and C3HC4-type zinc finger-containing protein 1
MDKVETRPPPSQKKNDLNRQNANRKSSDLFNILVEEKNQASGTVEASPAIAISSPNITKNKYRGVDNFNPTSFVFPRLSEIVIRKPVITSVVYKSSLTAVTKELGKGTQNHYQELVNLDFSNIAPNLEKFDCPICFMEISPKSGAVLRECLHSFCKPCLASHINYCEEAEIKCPFMDSDYSCQSLLQEREIKALVTKEEYDKHLARSIRQAENKIENTYHCELW